MAVDATMPTPVVSATDDGDHRQRPPPARRRRPDIADNFQTFLTLLTTQLQNQNPLDPLDTNQFTQQLVQFAGVEQQLKSNDQLKALVALREDRAGDPGADLSSATPSWSTAAPQQFNGSATWNLKAPKDATATITITNSTGQTVYSGNYALSAGNASFVWDGKGNDGTQWPAGNYKLTATAKDSIGQGRRDRRPKSRASSTPSISPPIPPLLSIGGQNYTIDQIRRVIRPSHRQLARFSGAARSPPDPPDPCPARRPPDAGPSALAAFSRRFVLKRLGLGKF